MNEQTEAVSIKLMTDFLHFFTKCHQKWHLAEAVCVSALWCKTDGMQSSQSHQQHNNHQSNRSLRLSQPVHIRKGTYRSTLKAVYYDPYLHILLPGGQRRIKSYKVWQSLHREEVRDGRSGQMSTGQPIRKPVIVSRVKHNIKYVVLKNHWQSTYSVG